MSTHAQVNKLKAAMQGMAGPTEAVPTITPPSAPPKVLPVEARPPSRRGKRVVSAYVAAAAFKQLRMLAAERDTSTQSLVEEALNDLFRKYNRSAVA